MRVKFGKRFLGVTMSAAILLTFTGCADSASTQISENLMAGITPGESGFTHVTPLPSEEEKGETQVEGSYSAVIEPMGNNIVEEGSAAGESVGKRSLENADELYAFLNRLDYSGVTYDNIQEYSITFQEGTQYYVDISGGIITCGDSSAKLADNEVLMLCQMMEAAKQYETEAENGTETGNASERGNGMNAGNASEKGNEMNAENVSERGNGMNAGNTAEAVAAAAVADFGVRLLRNSFSRDESRNTLISPLSVISALAMTANGAQGDTLQQMEDVFGCSIPELNSYLASYLQTLPEEEKYKLHIANAIWFKDSGAFSVEQGFLQANADLYHVGLYKAPFDHTTVKEINGWVAEHTDNMIKNILNEIDEYAVMYLVNALSFDAEWESVFYEHQVRDGIFTKEDGTTSKMKLMYSTERDYLETEQAEGFLKYYADRKYAFAALLPKEGVTVSELLDSLTGEELHSILEHPVNTTVHGAIPKFKSEYNAELREILLEMGMEDAFDMEEADFSGIGSHREGNLYISNVVHKTFIEVSERGTRAGAATMVAMSAGAAAPQEIRTVYLDRPFVYMIVDCETNLPVFIGTIMEV